MKQNKLSFKISLLKYKFCDENFEAFSLLKFNMNISCNLPLTIIKKDSDFYILTFKDTKSLL